MRSTDHLTITGKPLFSRMACAVSPLVLAIAISACGNGGQRAAQQNSVVERQTLYRELNTLEQSQTAPPSNGSDAFPPSFQEQIRNQQLETPATFEMLRNRRILAFERLTDMYPPEEAAYDFSAFWELHHAYRFLVQTSRFGYGEISLEYSRPYPVDHLSFALSDVLNYVDAVAQLETESALPPRPDTSSDLFAEVDREIRRMDMDLAAGIAPPLESVRRMIDQIDQSAILNETARTALRDARLLAYEAENGRVAWGERATFQPPFMRFFTPELRENVGNFRAALDRIEAAWMSSTPPHAFTSEYYEALIAQVTSGELTATDCAALAQREAVVAEGMLDALMRPKVEVSNIEAELESRLPLQDEDSGTPPAEPPTEAVEAETSESDVPEIDPDLPLSERLRLWLANQPAPFAREPDEGADLQPEAPLAETDTVAEGPVYSERFEKIAHALDELENFAGALLDRPMPIVPLVENGTPEPQPAWAQPDPIPESSLQPPTFTEASPNIALDYGDIARRPIAVTIVDAMLQFYPGAALLPLMQENREDLPQLSRHLNNAAFDLGWPHYALRVMDFRESFDDAESVNAIRLYRWFEALTEADIETNLFAGAMTPAEGKQTLIDRLGWTETQANDALDRMSVEPGLACAAIQGATRFEDLRIRAEAILGPRFNIREFHSVILAPGSRPLMLVERDVDAWIAQQMPASGAAEAPE